MNRIVEHNTKPDDFRSIFTKKVLLQFLFVSEVLSNSVLLYVVKIVVCTFFREECGLTVYNRAIPDFQIPTSGDLVNNILDLTYHLSKGENCLVHCAGGSGRTGMVIAAIVKNLGLYDPVARIRRVKSTYVETYDQELFLKNMPKAIDTR